MRFRMNPERAVRRRSPMSVSLDLWSVGRGSVALRPSGEMGPQTASLRMARLLPIENTGEIISAGFGTKGRPCMAAIIAKHLRDDSACLSGNAGSPLVSEGAAKAENDRPPRPPLGRDPRPLEIPGHGDHAGRSVVGPCEGFSLEYRLALGAPGGERHVGRTD